MAIIEELSSDEERSVPPEKPARLEKPAARPADIAASTESSNSVQRLVESKQALRPDDLVNLVELKGTTTTLHDILAIANSRLTEKPCDNLDIPRLERLTSIVALFSQHADIQQQVEELDSEDSAVNEFVNAVYEMLKIPSVFLKEDYAITSEDAQKQSFWLAGSTAVLQLLRSVLQLAPLTAIILAHLDKEARLVITLSKFTTVQLSSSVCSDTNQSQEFEPWMTPLSSKIASTLLSELAGAKDRTTGAASGRHSVRLAKHILLSYIKPLFTSSPHPMLNPDTGRKLDRRRGGDLFGDSYVDGDWKGQSVDAEDTGAVGCWRTYLYILSLIEKDEFEEIWPLLVPPMMTLLDDHQIYFRHQGILAVSAFLARTPPVLLRRTGLNDLIQQSLTTAFSFTSEAENVHMIRDAVFTNIQLLNLLYPKSSNTAPTSVSTHTSRNRIREPEDPAALTRFNTLSSIYQNCIISIFTYASSSIPFMTLAFDSIPLLIRELGKGSIRFLADSMTVLCSSLGGSIASKALSTIFTQDTVRMHIAAAGSMVAFVDVCRDAGRIERWRGMILSSVATLWCNVKEQEASVPIVELEAALKKVVQTLLDVCGEVARDCERMRLLDPALFDELL